MVKVNVNLEGLENVRNLAIRDGDNAIPINGQTIKKRCSFCDCERGFEVPIYIFNGNDKVKEEYRRGIILSSGVFVEGRELSNGVYISREGSFFCGLQCYSSYCES